MARKIPGQKGLKRRTQENERKKRVTNLGAAAMITVAKATVWKEPGRETKKRAHGLKSGPSITDLAPTDAKRNIHPIRKPAKDKI